MQQHSVIDKLHENLGLTLKTWIDCKRTGPEKQWVRYQAPLSVYSVWNLSQIEPPLLPLCLQFALPQSDGLSHRDENNDWGVQQTGSADPGHRAWRHLSPHNGDSQLKNILLTLTSTWTARGRHFRYLIVMTPKPKTSSKYSGLALVKMHINTKEAFLSCNSLIILNRWATCTVCTYCVPMNECWLNVRFKRFCYNVAHRTVGEHKACTVFSQRKERVVDNLCFLYLLPQVEVFFWNGNARTLIVNKAD